METKLKRSDTDRFDADKPPVGNPKCDCESPKPYPLWVPIVVGFIVGCSIPYVVESLIKLF